MVFMPYANSVASDLIARLFAIMLIMILLSYHQRAAYGRSQDRRMRRLIWSCTVGISPYDLFVQRVKNAEFVASKQLVHPIRGYGVCQSNNKRP